MKACMLEKEIRKLGIDVMVDIPKDVLTEATNRVMDICRHFPAFPDTDLITNLSGQTYEGKECYSNIVFLPTQYENSSFDYIVQYSEKVMFESKNIRFIRKLLESVGQENYLVMKAVSNKCDDYKVFGVISDETAKSLLAFRVEFTGHMSWRAAIKDQYIFKYENGGLRPVNIGEFDNDSFKKMLKQVFGKRIQDVDVTTLSMVTKVISKLGHGTSMVVFYSPKKYKSEIERLTQTGSGHGIKLEEEIDFSLMSEDEAENVLRQITKIDGGLILDIHGKCGAISCVFDGKLPKKYEHGTSSRGSRFNSLMLYIKTLSAIAFCVVVSDDGSVDYISKKT